MCFAGIHITVYDAAVSEARKFNALRDLEGSLVVVSFALSFEFV